MGKRLPLIALAIVLVACDDDPTSPSPEEEGLEIFRQATDRYHDVQIAIEDGFAPVAPCMENPEGQGGLGIPYLNEARLDTIIDLENPEVLFYEPQQDGTLQLIGGEPVVPIELWEAGHGEPPSLFGREFHRNEMAGLFGLHVWAWRDNPDGVFTMWHPDVSCQFAEE